MLETCRTATRQEKLIRSSLFIRAEKKAEGGMKMAEDEQARENKDCVCAEQRGHAELVSALACSSPDLRTAARPPSRLHTQHGCSPERRQQTSSRTACGTRGPGRTEPCGQLTDRRNTHSQLLSGGGMCTYCPASCSSEQPSRRNSAHRWPRLRVTSTGPARCSCEHTCM